MFRLILPLILFISLCPNAKAQNLTNTIFQNIGYYKTINKNTGDLVDQSFIQIIKRPEQTVLIHFEKGIPDYSQKEDYVFSGDYATLSGNIVNKTTGTDYQFRRVGNNVEIAGLFNNEMIKKSLPIDKAPFYAFSKFNLIPFVLSDKKKIEFWSMRTDTLEAYKMIATHQGREDILVNNKPVNAIKIFVTTANPLFRIFKRAYYYRPADGIFLKQEYSDGRVRELIREQ